MNEEDDLQVAILYNVDDEIQKGNPQDLLARQGTATTTRDVSDALTSLGYNTNLVPVHNSLDELEQTLHSFSPQKTFIFDNCDGFAGDNLSVIRVRGLIESLGFKHTGSTAAATELCTVKPRCKERLVECNVPTPAYQVFEQPEGELHMDFPAIVKPATEDASMGIDLDSVVSDNQALFKKIGQIIDLYHEPAMVEAFIPGRELAISMWGNGKLEILPISEQDYSQIPDPLQCLLTYEAKWDPDSPYYHSIQTRCPAVLSPKEKARVNEVSVSAFRAMGLRDFGRVDIRLNEGVPYVIDINEIPDLAPDAGFWNSARAAGYTYPHMVERILKLALRREGWR
jgi:D-alanine-D-alanine ligase